MTLEQRRAAMAYEHVSGVLELERDVQNSYGTLALKLPALLRTSGLCQTIHFLAARNKEKAAQKLLDHLAAQLERISPEVQEKDSLRQAASKAPFLQYLWLSREAIAVSTWYARLAKSELQVEPGDD